MFALAFPGQGSQHKGMGAQLFGRFPEETARADEILGYSIEELCRDDVDGRLQNTEYTQPALFVVNALSHLAHRADGGAEPDYLAGHSLGEYNALHAAGAFDFATGLRLVAKRGELMSRVADGGMAAVVGLTAEQVAELLGRPGLENLSIANYNNPTQTVVAGPREDVAGASPPKSIGGPPACTGAGPTGWARPRASWFHTARISASWSSKIRPRPVNGTPAAS